MATLKEKCLAYYTFGRVSELTDTSNKGHTLTKVGNPTITSTGGKPLKYANISINNAYRILNSASDMSFSSGGVDLPFSYNFWINPTTHNLGVVQMIFTKRALSGPNVEYFISFNTNGDFRFTTFDGGTSNFRTQTLASANITDGVWQMMTCNYDGANFTIYKDTVLQTTTRTNGGTYTAMNNTTEVVSMGTWSSGSNFYSGGIDSIGIFNDVLTSTEISTLYNGGLGLNLFDVSNSILLNGYGYSY